MQTNEDQKSQYSSSQPLDKLTRCSGQLIDDVNIMSGSDGDLDDVSKSTSSDVSGSRSSMTHGKRHWTIARNVVAFWVFGLCNNYGYVIMLSAASDIMDFQEGVNKTDSGQCEERITSRHCTSVSAGAVLLANNLPSLFVSFTFPFFMHRLPFAFRHVFICLLQAASYIVVAFSQNFTMSLAGVCITSFGSGLGEISYLALASYYPASVAVAAWSSGTGGAGLIGAFAYAFLTEKSMAALDPRVALRVQLLVPVVLALTYFFVLVVPDEVYTPGWHPRTWIVYAKIPSESQEENDNSCEVEGSSQTSKNSSTVSVPQRQLTFKQKIQHIPPILHLMIPLALVYVAQYMINQGLAQLIIFKCSEGFHLDYNAQYRWYQVLYQLGVFISRSSVKILELPLWTLFLLPVLQISNFTFLLFEAIYWFTPSIAIIFGVIIVEGLIGGASYVNTYSKIHKTVPPDVREYSMSVASVGNAMGINFAGFAAIPLHNYVCGQPVYRH